MQKFKNRESAGHLLADQLRQLNYDNPLVLALPRGGVPVAAVVGKTLGVEWDILFVRKITAPMHPEFAIGAIAEDMPPVWNDQVITLMSLKEKEMQRLADESKNALRAQLQMWGERGHTHPVGNREVIVVDDGLATGLTMQAGIQYLKRNGVAKIAVAIPVAPHATVEFMKTQVDDVICLETPDSFYSVGQWYDEFNQMTDNEVTSFLAERFSQGLSYDQNYASFL